MQLSYDSLMLEQTPTVCPTYVSSLANDKTKMQLQYGGEKAAVCSMLLRRQIDAGLVEITVTVANAKRFISAAASDTARACMQ